MPPLPRSRVSAASTPARSCAAPSAAPAGPHSRARGNVPDAPWVTSLAWSPASHWLAYALSTGAVGLVHVSLSPDSQQLSTHLVALVADADPRLVSTLTWVAPTVVAAAKGNAVFLWDVAAHTLRTVSVGPHGVIAALVPTADGTAVRVFTVAGNMYVVTLDGDVDHAEARATQRAFLARHGIYVPKGRQVTAQAAAAVAKAPRTSPASNGTPANGQGDEDDEEEEEEEDEDDEGVSVPSLTKKQARFYGACRSPNGIFTVVLYSIFPLNELYYRTDKSNTSFIDILPTTPVGDTDVEDAIFARLLHALQRGAGVPPTDAAAVPLGPGPWTIFWDLLAHVRHERRGRVPDMSSLARRLARVLDHWAIESAHAVQATHGVVPLFGRLRDFYTPMRWQAIVHRVLPAPTVLDLVHPAAEPPLPPPLAVHAAYLAEIPLFAVQDGYLAEIVRDLPPEALSVLTTVDDWPVMGAIVGAVALVGAGRAAFKGTLAALVAVLRRWQAQSATATALPGFGGHDIDAWVGAAAMAELATEPNAVLAAWTPAARGGTAEG
ncbi:hypothetical protein AMAG_19191 [Allomyces macrogynus ATCC 38327]|uniref:Uncharacterized protein n=1 Tax=Allomyces macrogynus (strain ATCC 38327) TaxID=578462 RepID=A0A0L0ST25_ALLM3|nr:hypothetical protein AMAG_19191 [Allomyces macrogynus ATCC 38327]|eukprot:KNE65651.1 hypothetical protein AMAG_19191 [Allomyces macrogynus ATCC 38327]